jgi:hypothetical protein
MENVDLKNETPTFGNVLLPAVAFGSSNTTSARCLNGHTWTYAGSIHYNLENHPCDCGAVLYHSEPCKCCGQNVVKPIPCNSW